MAEFLGFWDKLLVSELHEPPRQSQPIDFESLLTDRAIVDEERIYVSVEGRASAASLLALLESHGFEQRVATPSKARFQGFLPISSLADVVAESQVISLVPFNHHELTNSVGSVNNDGEIALRAEDLTAFSALTGNGVRIGVISDGVDNLANSQTSGDLPANVNVLNAGTGQEGRAMLELIHDFAPGAQLFFASGIGNQAQDFANAVNLLVNAQVDIIVDDLRGNSAATGAPNESWFMDDVASEAYADAVAAGVIVFATAGNRGNDGFESPFNFQANQILVPGVVGTFHNFNGAGDFTQTITANAGAILGNFDFQFDQMFGAVASDIRIWALDVAGNVLGATNINNPAAGDPNEPFGLGAFGINAAQIAIELFAGPAPTRFKWISDAGNDVLAAFDHLGVQGVLNTAHDAGHAGAAGVISVGATDVNNPLVRRNYSSIGTVTRSLDAMGAPLPTLVDRGGVEVMGVDGVATSVPGFQTFFGTSAAAPNVAAIAALLLEADPSLTPEGLRIALTDGAGDIDAAGFDLTSGAGLVDALGSVGVVQNTPQLIGLDDNEYILINDTRDLLDANPNDGVIDIDLGMAGQQVSLRAATIAANAGGNNATTLLVQAGTYNLTLSGSEGSDNAQVRDLDITGVVTIVGAGAGAAVINASAVSDRIFEINGANRSLDLSRVTLTGGSVSGSNTGGAIYVESGARLTLSDSALVGNSAGARGGGIRNSNSTTIIANSVFTGNQAGTLGGAISSTGSTSLLQIGGTVLAGNTATTNYANVEIAAGATRNNGYNVVNNVTGSGSFFTANLGDYIDTNATSVIVVTSMVDVYDTSNDATVRSLREAVVSANVSGGTIWLPAWRHRLTRNGAEGTLALFNDLDITAAVTIVGVGAGLSVVDASGLRNPTYDLNNRAFEVRGAAANLNLSRVTITSGMTIGSTAGNALLVCDDATLMLTDSAIVNHLGMANGVAIRSWDSYVTVLRCVFTNNVSTSSSSGIYATDSGSMTSSLTIGSSVFALNSAASNHQNVFAGNGVTTSSQGYNLYDSHYQTGNYFYFNGPSDPMTALAAPDYVVTSVADSFNHVDDKYSTSLREAIGLANTSPGQDEIWLPAWTYVLTRDRATFGGGSATDMNAAFGDLDIGQSLVIRRAAAMPPPGTAVKWCTGVAADAVFELLGDYNKNYSVDAADYVVWQSGNPAADGEDDGDVDAADYTVWAAHFGNTLTLQGFFV